MRRQQLTNDELVLLEEILDRLQGDQAMCLEILDGFLAALACCPEAVRPSEYLAEVWKETPAGTPAFATYGEWQSFTGLVSRHWHGMTQTLAAGDIYLPLLLESEQGALLGNNWALGFLRGVALRPGCWCELMENEVNCGALVPILALANEHHPDPELRPYNKPMDANQRSQLLAGLAAGLFETYRYFAPHRRMVLQQGNASEHSRAVMH